MFYIPEDAIFSSGPNVDRYQPVIGYAAITANTTIEYLGCLGEKKHMQVVSYIGTGTYGSSNPTVITVNFPIKTIKFITSFYEYESEYHSLSYLSNTNYYRDYTSIAVEKLSTNYTVHMGLGSEENGYIYGKKSSDGHSFYWYSTYNDEYQANNSGMTYYFLVLG